MSKARTNHTSSSCRSSMTTGRGTPNGTWPTLRCKVSDSRRCWRRLPDDRTTRTSGLRNVALRMNCKRRTIDRGAITLQTWQPRPPASSQPIKRDDTRFCLDLEGCEILISSGKFTTVGQHAALRLFTRGKNLERLEFSVACDFSCLILDLFSAAEKKVIRRRRRS